MSPTSNMEAVRSRVARAHSVASDSGNKCAALAWKRRRRRRRRPSFSSAGHSFPHHSLVMNFALPARLLANKWQPEASELCLRRVRSSWRVCRRSLRLQTALLQPNSHRRALMRDDDDDDTGRRQMSSSRGNTCAPPAWPQRPQESHGRPRVSPGRLPASRTHPSAGPGSWKGTRLLTSEGRRVVLDHLKLLVGNLSERLVAWHEHRQGSV